MSVPAARAARAGNGAGIELAERLRRGDLGVAPAVLNLVEDATEPQRAQTAALLHALSPGSLGREAPGHVVGVTGPPGAGKSSLLSHLLTRWRRSQRSVAVLAVDPSSRRSGGALLGDRARIEHDPGDGGVFIRSMAAGERVGGLAPATRAGAAALSCAFDVVVIETVGVGQSETEVAHVADTVAVVVQPGSGDVLQFLKAGIMEIPDLLVVTKSDQGLVARRAQRDLLAAVRSLGAGEIPVLAVSSVSPPSGFEHLIRELDRHRASLDVPRRRATARRRHALADFLAEHGAAGLRAVGGRRAAERWLEGLGPGLDVAALVEGLERRMHERCKP